MNEAIEDVFLTLNLTSVLVSHFSQTRSLLLPVVLKFKSSHTHINLCIMLLMNEGMKTPLLTTRKRQYYKFDTYLFSTCNIFCHITHC